MKQQLTTGIVLSRTNYGEADRIITLLTPDHGKLRLMARGVRRLKSKLAGGIELFSTSHITFLAGRGEVGTLVSSRLIRHYGDIVQDIDRVQLGYDLLKLLDRNTEDNPEPEYFSLLEQAFAALDESGIDRSLIRIWFLAQLLKLAGHQPNLHSDASGQKLDASVRYNFDFEAMAFAPQARGRFSAADIKLLRFLFSDHLPQRLQQITGVEKHLAVARPLLESVQNAYLRI